MRTIILIQQGDKFYCRTHLKKACKEFDLNYETARYHIGRKGVPYESGDLILRRVELR